MYCLHTHIYNLVECKTFSSLFQLLLGVLSGARVSGPLPRGLVVNQLFLQAPDRLFCTCMLSLHLLELGTSFLQVRRNLET